MHHRHDLALVDAGPAGEAQKMRHAWTIDIGIEEAHAAAGAGQADGDAGGDRALAHASLAAAHGDHTLGLDADLAELHRWPIVGHDRDGDVGHLGKLRPQAFFDPAAGLIPEDCRVGGEPYRDGHRTSTARDAPQLIHLGQRAAGFRIGEVGKGGADSRFVGRDAHGGLSRRGQDGNGRWPRAQRRP